MNKISEENPIPPKFFMAKYPIPPKFFMAKYPIPPKFDVRWEVSLIRKVHENLFPYGLSYYFVYLYHRIAKWIRRWCFPLPIYIIRKRNEDCKGII